MIRRSASTTSPICWARRRRCSSAISSRPIASARWPSAAPVAPGSDTYRIRQDRSQDQHIEGLPLGTVGGAGRPPQLPARRRVSLFARALSHQPRSDSRTRASASDRDHDRRRRASSSSRSAATTEAKPAGRCEHHRAHDAVDARLQVHVPVKAGPHEVGASFVRKIGEGTQRLRPFLRSSAGTYDSTGRPHIETLTIAGPFNPVGPGDTPSRQRIFSCRPETAVDEDACATKILSTLARRAYRRPVTKADTTSPAHVLSSRPSERARSTPGFRWRCAGCSPARRSCSASKRTARPRSPARCRT